MSFSLLSIPEYFVRKRAVVGTAKEDCKIEPQTSVSSVASQHSIECKSETGELGKDLEGFQYPISSCGIESQRSSLHKEQLWSESDSTESLEAGSEELDSDGGNSDSSVEELESTFNSQIYISSCTNVETVQEGKSEECKDIKGLQIESPVIGNSSIKQVIPASSNFVEVESFLAKECTEDLLTKGSGKPVLSTLSCTKLLSALRGGHEATGLGPRPRLSVTWAPDVYEPACTSVSHTVCTDHRRRHAKKDHKHRHKGVLSHSDSRKKSTKKVSPKSRHVGESFVLRTQAVIPQKGKYGLREKGFTESLPPPCNEHTLKSLKLRSAVLPQSFLVNGMVQVGDRRLVKLDAKLPCLGMYSLKGL